MAASRVPDVVNAAVDTLRADSTLVTLLGGPKVHTHVPKGTDPPYELVMGGDELPWALGFACDDLTGTPAASDGGDSGGRTVDVVVACVSTERGSAQVDDIASATLGVLTTLATWAGVLGFQAVDFVRNSASVPQDVAGDGVMWFQRTLVVRVTVQ